MIYLQTEGGLANRLRSIASAVKLASEYNTRITIIWNISRELNCPFADLFCLQKNDIYIVNHSDNRMHNFFDKIIRKLVLYRYIDINNEEKRAKFIEDFRKSPDRDYYIYSYSNFYDAHDYSFISPVPSIDMETDKLLSGISRDDLVGIQIRRTDNEESIAHSPTELFIQNMTAEITSHPNTVFYLATDDMNVRDEILCRFPDKVICNKTAELSRETHNGIIDAMIDFTALSRCRHIYGSYWSSFCEVASDIGKNKLTIVHKP